MIWADKVELALTGCEDVLLKNPSWLFINNAGLARSAMNFNIRVDMRSFISLGMCMGYVALPKYTYSPCATENGTNQQGPKCQPHILFSGSIRIPIRL